MAMKTLLIKVKTVSAWSEGRSTRTCDRFIEDEQYMCRVEMERSGYMTLVGFMVSALKFLIKFFWPLNSEGFWLLFGT